MDLDSAVNLLFSRQTQHTIAMAHEFWDIPWGKVPRERLGNLVPVASRPRGGLLGGGPKLSKLAALAAARKKQAEESKQDAANLLETNKSTDLLDELSAKLSISSVSASSARPVLNEPKGKESSGYLDRVQIPEETSPIPTVAHQSLGTPPSFFAQTLCRTSLHSERHSERHIQPATFPSLSQPYSTKKWYNSAGLFSKPSPDDVILAAQSKGSLRS
jgi:elongation factor 1 alpha-like protein